MERQLARMEANQEAMLGELRRFIASQEKHNEEFYLVRDEIVGMKAKQSGAWFVLSLFGTVTVALAGLASWVVAQFRP